MTSAALPDVSNTGRGDTGTLQPAAHPTMPPPSVFPATPRPASPTRSQSQMSLRTVRSIDEGDIENDESTLQYAVEVSYGGPQRPSPASHERHLIGRKRQFYEADLGDVEKQMFFTRLGMSEDDLALFLDQLFDAGEAGHTAREGLARMAQGFRRCRVTPKDCSFLLQFIGARLRSGQMQKEKTVGPLVPWDATRDRHRAAS